MERHPNPRAFPVADTYGPMGEAMSEGSPGMTLRDWFAGQALMSMLNAPTTIGEGTPAIAANAAYRLADAMLAERAKGGVA